jgi:hypothetical protein
MSLITADTADVSLVTSSAQPALPIDDHFLVHALRKKKLSVRIEPWDGPATQSTTRVLVLRAAWNSHLDPPKFLNWLNAKAPRCMVLNGNSTVQWNFDKRYLIELANNGFATVPTFLLNTADSGEIAEIISSVCTEEIVIKPRFGANAFGTVRLKRKDSHARVATHFSTFGRFGGVLIQPFISSVETERERSLIFVGQRFSHAVYRSAFNREPTRQSSDNIHRPTLAELRYCESLFDFFSNPPTYARFDLVPINGRPALMELELIDPSLFFSTRPDCAEELAGCIADAVSSGRA